MTRRPGLTMSEVLVALFVMALGTISVLTLFPLGMLNMSQALRDDRTAQAASAADGYMRWYWRTYVVENHGDANLSGSSSAFDNPGVAGLNAPGASERSYPVVVDPIGACARAAATSQIGTSSVPRVTTSLIGLTNSQALRTCTLIDGFTFGQNGLPDLSTGSIERDMRYNWLWVLQRPVNGNPTTATMSVVVFDRRSPLYVVQNSEASPTIVGGTLTTGSTGFTIGTVSGVLALNGAIIQRGTWIMDATVNGPANNGQPMRNAYFYRVVSATENSSGQLDVELESPIHTSNGYSGSYPATVVVLAGVADVFTRANLTAGP